jgi:diguanylate cyclase (GGDEF)-like protein
VLSVIASVTRDFKRGADVAARLGGEEFALLLPDTDAAGAVRVAQRLRATIEETRISDRRGGAIQITASFGVATITRNGSVDQVLSNADKALYRAKNAGRNRVCTPD